MFDNSLSNIFDTMGEKLQPYVRILRVAKKPGSHEFKTILKITGLGVILIGFVGFVIRMLSQLVH